MKAKRILALITVAVFMFAMMVVPASAEASVIIAPQDATVAPGGDLAVEINLTYAGHGGRFRVTYDAADLTYVDMESVMGEDAAATLVEDGKVQISWLKDNFTADDEAVFTLNFTAKAEIEGASEETTVEAIAENVEILDNDYLPIAEGIEYGAATITITLAPAAPVATAVTVLDAEGAALEAAPMVGETLTVSYSYSDVNGDVENTENTAIQWYADGEVIEGATAAEYTLTAAEIGAVITVGVTPANDAEKGDEGVEAVSEEGTLAVAVNPELKATIVEESLTIDPADKIRVGKPVTVSYELVSPNGGEDESIVVWTDEEGNELAGEISEDGLTFTPDNDDKNKVIKVTVTPKDSLTEANEEAVVELIAEVPVTKKSGSAPAFTGGTTLVDKEDKEEPGTDAPGTDAPVAGIEKFTDVDATVYAWAVEGIDALVKAGVIKGITDTTFEPETKTTRAHFVAMVIRAINAVDETAESTYADVAKDYWGYAEIATAQKLGALAILGENFEPEKVITREEMASVLYEVAKAKGIALGEAAAAEEFSDASSIAEGAAEAVTALQKAGIIAGMGDGTFAPKGETTRAQAAKVVYMVYKLA